MRVLPTAGTLGAHDAQYLQCEVIAFQLFFSFLFLLFLSSRYNAFEKKITDRKTQDAFAILLAAYHPRIKLLGVSTVFGNAPVG